MPWNNNRPRRTKYDAAHNTLRAQHMARLRAAGSGQCSEPVCVETSRVITADMDLHLSHDPSGRVVLGLSHRTCLQLGGSGTTSTSYADLITTAVVTVGSGPDDGPDMLHKID